MDKKISLLYEVLMNSGLVQQISEINGFPDEPSIFSYTMKLFSDKKNADEDTWQSNASGFSFESREYALIKCLAESAERLSNTTYKQKDLVFYSSIQLRTKKYNFLKPEEFTQESVDQNTIFGWIEGVELLTNQKILVPAQTVFFNYNLEKTKEPRLTELISTGAAAGFGSEQAVTHGILEVIERDAFMLSYMLKHTNIHINTKYINDPTILKIKQEIIDSNLEWHLFDISSDFEIPTMMSVLIDHTGLGPAVSVGLKTDFNQRNAVMGSLQESLHSRFFLRYELIQRKFSIQEIHPNRMNTLLDRGLYWSNPRMINKLDYLLDTPLKKIIITNKSVPSKSMLKVLKKRIVKVKKNMIIVEITHPLFKDSDFKVMKIVSPKVQPLYLHQHNLKLNQQRVEEYKSFFQLNNTDYNEEPHPFL